MKVNELIDILTRCENDADVEVIYTEDDINRGGDSIVEVLAVRAYAGKDSVSPKVYIRHD